MNGGIGRDNLFHPVMYLIDKNVKRHFNAANGGPTGEGGTGSTNKQYVEPIKLHRDTRGRLSMVEGWEYLDIELTYATNGLLDKVDVKHRLTGKHLQITLKYDGRRLLDEVIPELIDEGTGDPGKIDVPSVIEDY